MAYQSVGVVCDVESLRGLAQPLIPTQHPGVGYVTVHSPQVSDVFWPRLDSVFPGRWHQAFLSTIWHNGSIAPHCDALAEGQRFHVVLESNPDAWLLHGGVWTQPLTGHIYTMDPIIEHASVNWGHPPRTLLVINATPR